MPKDATEEELLQVDEEGRPYKIFLGQKVILRRTKVEPQPKPQSPAQARGTFVVPPPSPQLPEIEGPYRLDEHFASRSVVSLNEGNFNDYIKTKEKALVYFYDANASFQNVILENEFSQASDRCTHINYGFAGVDCFYDPCLCDQQNVKPKHLPMFKLYSNGFDLSSVMVTHEFNSDQMMMLMKMTPVLHQPRLEMGQEYISKTVEAPRKKRFKFPLM